MGRHNAIEPALYQPQWTWFWTMVELALVSGALLAGAVEAGRAQHWVVLAVFCVLLAAGQVFYWMTLVELVRFWLERPVDLSVDEDVACSYDDDWYDHHAGERQDP